jgi:predicted phage terminase large subunit-like protein
MSTANDIKYELAESLLEFTQTFYKLRTGRDFELSTPKGRESHYITICRALTSVLDGDIKRLIINVPPRYGKAIDTSTPMLTRNGWRVAGEIKEGDEIVGSSGWTKVNGVYPQGVLESKQVIFSDNQSVVCNKEHLWNVCDRYTPTYKTLTTGLIEQTIFEADGRKHWKIPLVEGDYGDINPFMDPYLFGCWLGDGHSHYAAITTMDDCIVNAFVRGGHDLKLHTHQNSGKAKTYGILGLSKTLRENGLLKNKHIPNYVCRWNKKNRLALLQGLMDTDGTCGKNGQVSFTNKNENIIKGTGYLVNSLGGIYRIYKRKCGTKTLNIRLPDEIPPFRLERKLRYVSKGIDCSPRRFIAEIIDIDPVEMVCFSVDADDKLFAVGEGLILTHNTELIIHFISWALGIYPDSNFMYVSYSHSLAKKQTQTVKEIITSNEYREIFGVRIKEDTQAKDNFETTKNGSIYAVGAGGSIVGRGAGIKGCERFGGCIVIDDIHKPNEASSDIIREGIIDWYYNSLQSRLNSPNTPLVLIGQIVHEDDLLARLRKDKEFSTVIIPAIDQCGNALHPEMHDIKTLRKMQETMPYHFAAQYQQDPQPAGGGIFRPDWFVQLDIEPDFIATFITADTAETDKDYNDATVFSFWGMYEIGHGEYALHWIDCRELRIEPKDLEHEFMAFYADCMRHKKKPRVATIEKKSTGTTLVSSLDRLQGLRTIGIERTKASGSKTARFLEMQPYVASKCVSVPEYAKHTKVVLDHMRRITANDSHAHDDICDTLYDAVKFALIDRTLTGIIKHTMPDRRARLLNSKSDAINRIKGRDTVIRFPDKSPFE